MRPLKISVVLLSAMLQGCSIFTTETKPSAGMEPQMCKSLNLIQPSRKDVLTPGTVEMIVGDNAAKETWCPELKKRPPNQIAQR